MDAYENSRMDLYSKLVDQVSLTTGDNLYDRKNAITRMIFMGIPKDKIISRLMLSSIFRENLKSLEDSMNVTNPIEKAALLRFKDFYESLKNLKDLEETPNYAEIVAEKISKSYPEAVDAINLAKSGAEPKEIFAALNSDQKWKDDAWDYMTRGDVEIPKINQRSKWASFRQIIDSINDLNLLK